MPAVTVTTAVTSSDSDPLACSAYSLSGALRLPASSGGAPPPAKTTLTGSRPKEGVRVSVSLRLTRVTRPRLTRELSGLEPGPPSLLLDVPPLKGETWALRPVTSAATLPSVETDSVLVRTSLGGPQGLALGPPITALLSRSPSMKEFPLVVRALPGDTPETADAAPQAR